MDKKEQLIEYITQDIIVFLVEDYGIEYEEAMREFYASETFLKLTDVETGLYYESAAYVYELYKGEKQTGCLVQRCE